MTISSAILADEILSLAAREGNEILQEQVNLKAPLYAELEHRPCEGKLGIVNIDAGGIASTTMIADGGLLSTGAASSMVQGSVPPKSIYSAASFGREAMQTLGGVDDSIDLLETEMDRVSTDLARQVGRTLFGNQLGSPAVNTSWVTVTPSGESTATISCTVRFSDAQSDFRVGESYNWLPSDDGYGDNDSFTILCYDIAIVSDTQVDVTFTNQVPGVFTVAGHLDADLKPIAIELGDTFWIRGSFLGTGLNVGQTATSNQCVSLNDITGTGTLYGLPNGVRGWRGLNFTVGGILSQEFILGKVKQVRQMSGRTPDLLLLPEQVAASYAVAQLTPVNTALLGFGATAGLGAVRRNSDGPVLDKYGKGTDTGENLRMFGHPVVVDPNCPADKAYLIDSSRMFIFEWMKPGAFKEGSSSLLLSRSNFSYDIQYAAMFNLATRSRSAHARLSGISYTG